MNIISKATENVRLLRLRLNSFVNEITGLGTWKDKTTQYKFMNTQRISYESINAMYRDSAITRNIIDSIVDDSLKNDIDIDHEISDSIINKLNEIKLFNLLKRAGKTARQTGGAVIFFHVNDGNLPEIPVNHKRIKEVKAGFILSKYSFTPMTSDKDGKAIDWFYGAEIEFYKIKSNTGVFQIWHKSRVLELKGGYAGEEALNENNGIYESLIDLNRKAILLCEIFRDSISNVTDSAIQEVLKIEGLENKLKKKDNTVFNMLQAIMMGKSTVNKLVLSKNDEFQYHSANLTGYEKIREIVESEASMSSRIPISKLFGKSPSASIGSQSGGYEEKLWINEVETYQKDLGNEIKKAIEWIKPLFKISQDEIIIFSFPSLYPIDPKTDAEIRKIQSETDKNYIDKGVVKPEEVALSRFKGKWSMNTQINLIEREKALNAKTTM